MSKILLIDAPGEFRDSVLAALRAHGGEAITRDDGMEVLATLDSLQADVILIGEAPGAPGAVSLGRIISRERRGTLVFQLGELAGAGPLPTHARFLPRALGASGVAAAMLGSEAPPAVTASRTLELAARGLPVLLRMLCDQQATGLLQLEREGTAREIVLVRGMPVAGHTNLLDERLGALAVASGDIDEGTLERALLRARDHGTRLGQTLVELRALGGDDLHRLLARQLRLGLTNACADGPFQARFHARPEVVDEFALLPTHPMCAVLEATCCESDADIQQAFGALAGMPVRAAVPSPSVDRWLHALGIDVATAIEGASSYGAMLDSLSRASKDGDEEDTVAPEALALALTWVGRIAPDGDLPQAAALFASVTCEAPPVGSLWAEGDDATARMLDARLRLPSVDAAAARARALHGAEAEFEGVDAELSALYLTVMGTRDHRTALAVAQNASHTEIRRAYHARLEHLDGLDTSAAPASDLARELRARFDRARSAILPSASEALLSVAPTAAPPQVASPRPVSLPPAPAGSLSAPPPVASAPPAAISAPPQDLSEPPALRSGPPPVSVPTPPLPSPAASAREAGTATGAKPPPLPGVRTTRGADANAPPERAAAREADAPASPEDSSAATTAVAKLSDEELESANAVLEQGNWQALLELLDGRDGKPADLPAQLRLLYAIALKEVASSEGKKPRRISAERLGMEAVGELMLAPSDSPAVRIVARRALRKRPLDLQTPPSRGVSFILTAIALAIGVGGGLIFSGEIFELLWK